MRMIVPLLLAAALAAPAQSADQLAQEAAKAYGEKRYTQAAALYTKVFEQNPLDPSAAYNASCSYALAGDRESAFRWLERAVLEGYFNAESAAQDSDLAGLRADARWEPLLTRMRTTSAREKAFWDSSIFTTPFQETLPEDVRIAGLSRFWSEVKFNFIDTDRLAQIDWDRLYLEALPRVRAATTTADYYRELKRLCARIGDGHTNIYPPGPLRVRANHGLPLLRTSLVEGRVLVASVFDEGLRVKGLLPGVEITSVDGRPVKAYAEAELIPFESFSTPQNLEARVYSYPLLAGPLEKPVRLGLRDAEGHAMELQVPRADVASLLKVVPNDPPFAWRMLPGNVAYVALNSFLDNTAAEQYLAAFPELSKASALILDVRMNGGGNSGVGWRILATLAERPFATSRWSTRDYKPAFRAWNRGLRVYSGPAHTEPVDPSRHFAGPVLVLTSGATFSAAEDFAVAFDAMQRGLIVGEPTGGSTGQPLVFSLPGGGSARVCTKRDTYPDGRPFVGVGVQPGRLVRPTVADLRAGRDTVLEAALAELARPGK